MVNVCSDLTAVFCIYNGTNSLLFKKSLSSILTQDLLPKYTIIAEDGFLSASHKKVIDDFQINLKKLGITFISIKSPTNIGHGLIRNKALSKCITKYVAICDSDDISLPNRFSTLLPLIKNSDNLAVVGSWVVEKNLFVESSIGYVKSVPINILDVKNQLSTKCPVNQMSIIFNLEYVKSVNGYENFYHNEDYYLWIKLINFGYDIMNVSDCLVIAHIDDDSFSRRGGFKYFLSESKIQVILYKLGYKSFISLFISLSIRFVVQVIFPNYFRSFFYKTFLRNIHE